jgi:hypothetical protein
VGGFTSERGNFRICNKQRRTSKIGRFLKFVKIPLILGKIFENMAAKSETLLLIVGLRVHMTVCLLKDLRLTYFCRFCHLLD